MFKKSKTTKCRKIKTIGKDGEHSMTVTGALPPCGKIKAKNNVLQNKRGSFSGVKIKAVFLRFGVMADLPFKMGVPHHLNSFLASCLLCCSA